jgi:TIR domain.
MASLTDNANDASKQPPQRTRVFISYSRKDKRYLDELHTQLKFYERQHLIDFWDDTKIRPGARWREELNQALQSARVGVLLVSADFLDSDFINEYELPPLLEAAKNEGTKIISVMLKPCAYKYTELAEIQIANDPSRPLNSISKAQREKIWYDVAEFIKKSLEDA